jgi:hypothetical protein
MNVAATHARLVLLIPTRNRAHLAAMAIASAQSGGMQGVNVVVSDNSTIAEERYALERTCDEAGVALIAPPEPVPMRTHWAWALERAMELHDPSHVSVLTDRMLFKEGWLVRLWEIARVRPGRVLSYNHDEIIDEAEPVTLIHSAGSGQLVTLDSRALLELSAKAHVHPAIPRLLNAIVPVEVVDEVRARFGSVFASVSPDFSFGYRCLDVVDSIDFLDYSPLVHHASASSNGRSYARGIATETAADFVRELGLAPEDRHHATPVPELQTVLNACLHEYCLVRAESISGKFPPLDMAAYLASSARQIRAMEDPQTRERMLAIARGRGLTPLMMVRARARALLTPYARTHPRWLLKRVRAAARRRVWRLMPGGLPADKRVFATAEEALRYAVTAPAPKEPDLTHLGALVERDVSATVAADARRYH